MKPCKILRKSKKILSLIISVHHPKVLKDLGFIIKSQCAAFYDEKKKLQDLRKLLQGISHSNNSLLKALCCNRILSEKVSIQHYISESHR